MKQRTLPARPLSLLRQYLRGIPPASLALALFAVLSLQPLVGVVIREGRWTALPLWLAMLTLGVVFRHRPLILGPVMIAASIVLRLHSIGLGYGDQMAVSQAAWERVLAGGGPYGVGYAETTPPGAPFPYGPLGLIWWLPGPVVEFVAVIGLMALLLQQRAWLTLAIVAGWLPAVQLTFTGVNDYSPALLIALAVVLLRARPLWGAATLAVAAALKPYAFAWFLPAIGYGRLGVATVLVAATVVLWSPMFLWWGGVISFLETIRLAARAHPEPNALNVPILRWMAVPFVALSMIAQRWDDMAILGGTAFIIFLFLDHWASYGYWLAVIPVLGMALERRFYPPESEATSPQRRRGDARRARRAPSRASDPATR